MTRDNLIEFKTPEPQESFSDALSDLVRQIIAQAVEAELKEGHVLNLWKWKIMVRESEVIVPNDSRACSLSNLPKYSYRQAWVISGR
jgi:hypothetical protein